MHNDREVAKSKARVDISHNWRIWSQSRIFPGDWAVLLKDGEGRLQAEQRFVFTKPGDTAAARRRSRANRARDPTAAPQARHRTPPDRKSAGSGKGGSGRVDLGGRRD